MDIRRTDSVSGYVEAYSQIAFGMNSSPHHTHFLGFMHLSPISSSYIVLFKSPIKYAEIFVSAYYNDFHITHDTDSNLFRAA